LQLVFIIEELRSDNAGILLKWLVEGEEGDLGCSLGNCEVEIVSIVRTSEDIVLVIE
jgi:hypothetical protein